MTVVSINQPAYLPWDGYFDRIRQSDLHIVLDHVQFEKGSATNRCLIRQRDGRTMWLTVPVEKGKPINETRVSDYKWKWKHRMTLAQAYPTCDIPVVACQFLGDVARLTTWAMLTRLGLPPQHHLSSRMGGDKLGHKSDLVLNICKQLGATRYLSGPQGANYLNIPAFEKAGIEVTYYVWQPPTLPLSAIHDIYSGEEFAWPQAHLISGHC